MADRGAANVFGAETDGAALTAAGMRRVTHRAISHFRGTLDMSKDPSA
jgi:hypothetical protein